MGSRHARIGGRQRFMKPIHLPHPHQRVGEETQGRGDVVVGGHDGESSLHIRTRPPRGASPGMRGGLAAGAPMPSAAVVRRFVLARILCSIRPSNRLALEAPEEIASIHDWRHYYQVPMNREQFAPNKHHQDAFSTAETQTNNIVHVLIQT